MTYDFGAGPVPAHRHVNPDGTEGGWVADTATVAPTAYVGPGARVYGDAWVYGDARVYGAAQVVGSARVYGDAWVYGASRVSDGTIGTLGGRGAEPHDTPSVPVLADVARWEVRGRAVVLLVGRLEIIRGAYIGSTGAVRLDFRSLADASHALGLTTVPGDHSMHSIELFTGAGGLALGTHAAGFRHRALFEWNGDACQTIRENARRAAIPGTESWDVVPGDVRSVNFASFEPVDLVAGGPPCQPFSIGGKHRGDADNRNMIPEFARAVRELKPRAFLMENVKGLLRENFRNYFEYAILQLSYPDVTPRESEDWRDHLRRLEEVHTGGRFDGLRYNVVFQLLNAADYGVPQARQRVFVVGFRTDLGVEWHFPKPTHSRLALAREQWVTGDYWRRHGIKQNDADEPRSPTLLRAARESDACQPWRTVRDALKGLPEPSSERDSPLFANHRLIPGARSYPGHTGSPIDLPAKTLKAGVHGVPGGENMMALPDGSVRYFTVREAARLQTFPDRWVFAGAWSEAMRQLGNAVPMELAGVVAGSIQQTLGALDAS